MEQAKACQFKHIIDFFKTVEEGVDFKPDKLKFKDIYQMAMLNAKKEERENV